jgi:hypothetical protein
VAPAAAGTAAWGGAGEIGRRSASFVPIHLVIRVHPRRGISGPTVASMI